MKRTRTNTREEVLLISLVDGLWKALTTSGWTSHSLEIQIDTLLLLATNYCISKVRTFLVVEAEILFEFRARLRDVSCAWRWRKYGHRQCAARMDKNVINLQFRLQITMSKLAIKLLLVANNYYHKQVCMYLLIIEIQLSQVENFVGIANLGAHCLQLEITRQPE